LEETAIPNEQPDGRCSLYLAPWLPGSLVTRLVDIKALLGHSTLNTTQIYTNVGQARMAAAKWR